MAGPHSPSFSEEFPCTQWKVSCLLTTPFPWYWTAPKHPTWLLTAPAPAKSPWKHRGMKTNHICKTAKQFPPPKTPDAFPSGSRDYIWKWMRIMPTSSRDSEWTNHTALLSQFSSSSWEVFASSTSVMDKQGRKRAIFIVRDHPKLKTFHFRSLFSSGTQCCISLHPRWVPSPLQRWLVQDHGQLCCVG